MGPTLDSPAALLKKKQTQAVASKTSKTAASPRTPVKRPRIEDSDDDSSDADADAGTSPAKKVKRGAGRVS